MYKKYSLLKLPKCAIMNLGVGGLYCGILMVKPVRVTVCGLGSHANVFNKYISSLCCHSQIDLGNCILMG